MKPGRASRTAVMVCAGRAASHGRTPVPRFDDPIALDLLPDYARARVDRLRAGTPEKGARARIKRAFLERHALVTAVRTVAIDDAIRERPAPQLVVLGAGLDSRAWRMPELRGTVVFEVDHPDTQRDKRERARSLEPKAREVRFVSVDFARDSLDDALARAGHDPSLPSTWLWEGVVMYLTRPQIEATLAVIERRSRAASRLIVLYHSPALILRLVGPVVRWIGEPLRSVFTPDAMRALLAERGFAVVRDGDIPTLAASMPPDVVRGVGPTRHLRIAVADFAAPR